MTDQGSPARKPTIYTVAARAIRQVRKLLGGWLRSHSDRPSNDTAKASDIVQNMGRRPLLMLRELHRMGYERLRAVTGLSPSGCHWRLWITPAIGVLLPDQCVDFLVTLNRSVAVGAWLVYAKGNMACTGIGCSSTGQEGQCFGWIDSAKDSPIQLAEKFVERFPTVTAEGKGDDADYARWYDEMIEATEPDGLIYMYADWEMPTDHIPVLNMDVRIPPPPQVKDE